MPGPRACRAGRWTRARVCLPNADLHLPSKPAQHRLPAKKHRSAAAGGCLAPRPGRQHFAQLACRARPALGIPPRLACSLERTGVPSLCSDFCQILLSTSPGLPPSLPCQVYEVLTPLVVAAPEPIPLSTFTQKCCDLLLPVLEREQELGPHEFKSQVWWGPGGAPAGAWCG